MSGTVRVLIVDDSAFVRKILRRILHGKSGIEVVGEAADAYEARDAIVATRPDVITLDVEMPRMDGVEFLRRLIPQAPIPVVMVSSLTDVGSQATLDALAAGAVDFVAKPQANVGAGLADMADELRCKVCAAAGAHVQIPSDGQPEPSASCAVAGADSRLIAIGASTGGTTAIRALLDRLPSDMPPIVVVQHMPALFVPKLVERLDRTCRLEVRVASDGEHPRPGQVLIAPGDAHLELLGAGPDARIKLRDGDRVKGHRPSVSVMMRSVANAMGSDGLGVVLTGMGDDGADGLLEMRQAGAPTLAQDEATSVIFGMPRAAHEAGAAERLVPLDEMPAVICEKLRREGR